MYTQKKSLPFPKHPSCYAPKKKIKDMSLKICFYRLTVSTSQKSTPKRSLPSPKNHLLCSKNPPPPSSQKNGRKKLKSSHNRKNTNILTISLLLCSKKTHPALPPKKDKRYELKNIKMLLQIDNKYHSKKKKKDSLKKILTIPK